MVVAKVTQPSYAELKAKIAQLEAAQAIANQPGKLTIRINDAVNAEGVQGKGTVLRLWAGAIPVALYAEQWRDCSRKTTLAPYSKSARNPRASRKVR